MHSPVARMKRSEIRDTEVLPVPRITALRPSIRATLYFVFIACLPPPVPANGEPGKIEHVVVVWLKTPGDRAAREQVIAASQTLTSIPGVTGLKAGTMVPGERAIVDSSFDVALIVSFTDRAALQAYLTHPVHVRLVEETLKPLVNKIRVYDIGM